MLNDFCFKLFYEYNNNVIPKHGRLQAFISLNMSKGLVRGPSIIFETTYPRFILLYNQANYASTSALLKISVPANGNNQFMSVA